MKTFRTWLLIAGLILSAGTFLFACLPETKGEDFPTLPPPAPASSTPLPRLDTSPEATQASLSATPTPTPSNTPVPTLMAHTWQPQNVLVRYNQFEETDHSLPPRFTLFADGQVFILKGFGPYYLMHTQLTEKQTCKLLYSIEQTGFLDFKPSISKIYSPPEPSCPPFYHLEVNAWQSNQMDIYSSYCLNKGVVYLPVNATLRKVIQLVSGNLLEGLQVYQPERFGIWIDDHQGIFLPFQPRQGPYWPLISPKLVDLYSLIHYSGLTSRPSTILEGYTANKVFQLLGPSVDKYWRAISEGNYHYSVYARPLLPDEFTSGSARQTDFLNCSPTDGLLVTPKNSPTPTLTQIHLATLTPSRTPTPTRYMTPTLTPKPATSTPVPSLVAHSWIPQTKLIEYNPTGGGDGGCMRLGNYPSRWTLYADGRMYVLHLDDKDQILMSQLSESSVCKLLNTIDQAGFFDYDPSTYLRDPIRWVPPYFGIGHINIEVIAWRSKSISISSPYYFLYDLPLTPTAVNTPSYNQEFPTILPALRRTYDLIAGYQPEKFEVYQPERLGLWIKWINKSSDDAPEPWPFNSINLSSVITPTMTGDFWNEPNLILEGAEAAKVFQFFDRSIPPCGKDVDEYGQEYYLFSRPLLPDEYTSKPDIKLAPISCSPADGVLPIPTLTPRATPAK
jgi:hypothetical protein